MTRSALFVAVLGSVVGCGGHSSAIGKSTEGTGGAPKSSDGGHAANTGGDASGGVTGMGGSGNGGGHVATGGRGAGGSASGGTNAGGVIISPPGGARGMGDGGTAGASGAGGSAGGGAGGAKPLQCATFLNASGKDTGFDKCTDGTRRRRKAITCPLPPTSTAGSCMPSACAADGDCTQHPLGFCSEAHHLSGYCGCFYGCLKDSDCPAGNICDCGTLLGKCIPAKCTSADECGAGSACIYTFDGHAGPPCLTPDTATYSCSKPPDECTADSDCPRSPPDMAACLYAGDHRVCGTLCALIP